MCTEDAYVSQALRNGASAFVLKSRGFVDLLHAVYEVVAGRKHLSPELDADAIRQLVARLSISQRTAETHRANIRKKFEFARHADLVSFALRRGLLTRDL